MAYNSNNPGFTQFSSWGRTRQPKNGHGLVFSENLVGNENYILPYADHVEDGDNWDRAALSSLKGIITENQRYMHLIVDSSTIVRANKNLKVAALGYIKAFDTWTTLYKPWETGNDDWAFMINHTVTGEGPGSLGYYTLEILGVDKVLLYYGNSNADHADADHIIRIAFNTF